jgi:hypothetical protein
MGCTVTAFDIEVDGLLRESGGLVKGVECPNGQDVVIGPLGLGLVAAAYLMTPVDEDLLKAAEYVVFVFAGFGMWLSWTVMNLSLGGPAFPPLGPTLIKPKAVPTT